MPKQELVIFSIGPVQSFISAARRTQDLRTSSQILSKFSQIACTTAQERGCELIYPQIHKGNDGIPNRIVINTDDGNGQSVAKEMITAINRHRDDISNLALTFFLDNLNKASFNQKWWTSQVENWLEFYWAVVPWDGNDNSYQKSMQLASLMLDGRKSTKHYPTSVEGSATCTLCAQRSALGGKEFWRNFSRRNVFKKQECLCAVCTIKRLLPFIPESNIKSAQFPSLASVAISSYRAEITKNDTFNDQISNFCFILNEIGLDNVPDKISSKQDLEKIEGEYFYPEFYQIESLTKEIDKEVNPALLIKAREALNKLNQALGSLDCEPSRPNPYYAILQIDGDYMGKMLAGIQNKEDHIAISTTLSDLSLNTPRIVAENFGYTVYSGGDDVLALFPVNSVLQAANQIQLEFSQRFAAIGHPSMHMSAGISITHYNQPMQAALNSAREAEKEAKDMCQRNALTIFVQKRSGEFRKAALKWTLESRGDVPITQIQYLLRNISQDHISGKFAFELWEETPALHESTDCVTISWFEKELYRLLNRHSQDAWKKNVDLYSLAHNICYLWDFMPYEDVSKVEQIVQWLLVTRFLAQGDE